MIPQIIVSLSPNGELVAELPGLNGSRRKVNLKSGSAEKDLIHILKSQLKNKIEIGLDGAPTQSQTLHWERHGMLCEDISCKKHGTPHSHEIWSDPSCPHCKAEGRFEAGYNRERAIKNLTENEALKLGLISRGFDQSKNNPDIWTKKNMGSLFLKPDGKILNHQHIQWSKDHRDALILDGKIHAKQIGFVPSEAKPRKISGGITIRRVTKVIKETQKEKLQRKFAGKLHF